MTKPQFFDYDSLMYVYARARACVFVCVVIYVPFDALIITLNAIIAIRMYSRDIAVRAPLLCLNDPFFSLLTRARKAKAYPFLFSFIYLLLLVLLL